MQLQPLLCHTLAAASVATVCSVPTTDGDAAHTTLSCTVPVAEPSATLADEMPTASAVEVAEMTLAAIGALARVLKVDGIKAMHHQLCKQIKLEELPLALTPTRPTCVSMATAATSSVRAHALRALGAVYDALGDSALPIAAEALPVASEAMEDGDTLVRQAALSLMSALESLPERLTPE